MAPPFLRITDGTTVITIQDGAGGATNYPLERGSWAPAVAPRRRSAIGGAPPVDDVAEELRLAVTDTTAAGVYAKIQALNDLLDQAEVWSYGDNASPVLLQYSPGDSTVSSSANPLQAAIIGRAPDDESRAMVLPEAFSDGAITKYMASITVRFWRRGQLLRATDTANASGTSSAKISITLTSHGRLSPVVLSTDNLSQSATKSLIQGSYLITTAEAAAIDVQNAASAVIPSNMTAAASSMATFPAGGGNILRTTASPAQFRLGPATALRTRKLAVFAMVCQTVAGDTWQIIPRFTPDSLSASLQQQQYLPPVVISAGTVVPFPLFLGLVTPGFDLRVCYFDITRLSGSGQLEFDIVVFVATDDLACTILAIGDSLTAGAIDRRGFGAVSNSLVIDHQLLTKPDPKVVHRDNTAAFYDIGLSTRGNPMVMQRGANLTLLWLAGAQSNAANHWRVPNSGVSAAQSNTWTVTRSRAYLAPE